MKATSVNELQCLKFGDAPLVLSGEVRITHFVRDDYVMIMNRNKGKGFFI